MGLLADIGKLSADSVAAATLQGQLQTAEAAVTSIQAQIDGNSTTTTADDATVSADLQALPAGTVVRYPNTDGTFSGYSFSSAPPGFTIVPVIDAT
jgi:hypothetical protein